MNGESPLRRGQLKGYIFEVIILKLLARNGFSKIDNAIPNKVKITRNNNVEIKGRGTWHQIDCPCLYQKAVPFIYDLRLLSEVKFYSTEIQKDKIRQYIGTIKDISENYFIDEIHTIENQKKYTDIGVFFAANGFQLEAEKLAFVHGIKTISYKNNEVVRELKELITILERDYLRANMCISTGNQNNFLNKLSEILDNPDNIDLFAEFEEDFHPEDGYRVLLVNLGNELRGINSSFFGITETNYFIHFLSNNVFPTELFTDTDTRECRVFYNPESGDFHLTINGDNNPERRFYFSAPRELIEKVFTSPSAVVGAKGEHFSKVSVAIELNGIQRNLTLQIDQEWIEGLA